MNHYVCIHGHFYQPPRENPWLEAIELQDAAYPYHDWNEKITAECYAMNATARIIDERSRIVQIVNNYSRISFNFGPTLLAWLEQKSPDVYAAILEADRKSLQTFSGHGSAIAQAYSHMILPLANRRDKYTQTLWGIRDFERRFGRQPEGMWLPETAVDLESLDVLAELGIRFTILAPRQAQRIRPVGEETWQDVCDEKIDPSRAYRLNLPSGRSISLFFYDGPVSRDISFGRLLNSGEDFAGRLLNIFSEDRSCPQLVHVAVDGETFGHHRTNAQRTLAYALHYIESNGTAQLTNYGEFLEKYPPEHEVEIFENSSWSCVHGIERWRSDCGCSSCQNPEWNQKWRQPLRTALDWLRDNVNPVYEEKAKALLKDPWEARNDYIEIILNRSPQNLEHFLGRQASGTLTAEDRITILKLLELQRHAMLMYTSCGWFFDDLSGIETVQIIQYAGWILQMSPEILGREMESGFLELLEKADSNLPEYGNGRRIYEKFVRPAMVDLEKVCAHYAMSSLFNGYDTFASVYCYTAAREDYRISETGKAKLLLGKVNITSIMTEKSARFYFGVLYLGEHTLVCGVKDYQSEETYRALIKNVSKPFNRADFPGTLRQLDQHFAASMYSLRTIFRDEQRKIMDVILGQTLKETEIIYRQVYLNNAPMMRFIQELNIPKPKVLYSAAEVVLNARLLEAFESDEFDTAYISEQLEEARMVGLTLDAKTLEFALRKHLERILERFIDEPMNIDLLENLKTGIEMTQSLSFQVNLRTIQNHYHSIHQSLYLDVLKKSDAGEADAIRWNELFTALGEALSMAIT